MRGVLVAAVAAFSLVGVSARAEIDGVTPSGYVNAYGMLDGSGSWTVLTGTHLYTFWTYAALPDTSSPDIGIVVWGKVHADSDFGGMGYMFDNYQPGNWTDLAPLRVDDGRLHQTSFWVTLPEDTSRYMPDWWGPGNGNTERTHWLSMSLVGGYWGEDQAGMPYWLTTDDPGALRAVPEPATWALMIAGFGLTGTALRRRRTAYT